MYTTPELFCLCTMHYYLLYILMMNFVKADALDPHIPIDKEIKTYRTAKKEKRIVLPHWHFYI